MDDITLIAWLLTIGGGAAGAAFVALAVWKRQWRFLAGASPGAICALAGVLVLASTQ